jgi:MFS family permease
VAASPAALALSAFGHGMAFSFWIVSLPPAVSHLTADKRRERGFSLWLGSGIATGVLGGTIGSRLPGWFAAAGAQTGAQSKQLAMLAGCGIALLALWPLARLRLPPAPPVEAAVYPRGSFVRRYLLALALWQAALGGFNPLFNAYFSRGLGASVEQIGNLFAGSQLTQALAVLGAPAVLRRFGLLGGTSGMQAAAAVCLGLLACGGSVSTAALVYAAYMSAHVMAEPGMFTALMNHVTPGQRLGASSLNFLVMFGCQAAAAAIGGWTAAAYGYRALLAAAAATAAISAVLFRLLLAPVVQEQARAARAAGHAG